MDEARDPGELGGGDVTSPAPTKQTQRRQSSPAKAVTSAMPPVAEGNDSSLVLDLLIALLSHMQVIEEYITQIKEADAQLS